MIVDMRYHLATLMSVFFALGLGILIGTSMNSDGQLLQEQASLMDVIDGQLQLLRTDKEQLAAALQQRTDELADYRSFATKMVTQSVAGRLSDKEISLVNLGSDALTKQVEELLVAAGAHVVSHARISDPKVLVGVDFAATNPLATDLVASLLNGMHGSGTSSSNLVRWVKPGIHMAQQHQVVVIGTEQIADPLRGLALAMGRNQVSVVAAVTGEDLRAFRAAGVQAVSDVSTPMGLLALVEMLER